VVPARAFRHGRSSLLGNLLADLERLHHSAPLSRFPEPPLITRADNRLEPIRLFQQFSALTHRRRAIDSKPSH
jgi:hypothetical protein